MGTGNYLKISNGDDQQVLSELDRPSRPREPTRLALVSTIQFAAALQNLKDNLSPAHHSEDHDQGQGACDCYEASIPRSKPLSPGEILGCTAPTLRNVDALV